MDRASELAAVFSRVAELSGASGGEDALRRLAVACGWGARTLGQPLLPSGVSHGVPWGVSFVLGAGAPEVRVFVEPQAEPASLASYLVASERVASFVAREPGADVRPLEAVRALFARVWYAVAFRPHEPPAYRAYLCLGPAEREQAVARALARLGVVDTASRGPRDLVTMVGLDLHASPRTKLYVLRPDYVLDHPFARALPGGDAPMGWLSCHVLHPGAPRVAWHYGAARHAPNDADLSARLRAFLEAQRIDSSLYERVRQALPARHHFVTWQRIGDAPRVTVYLLPQVHRP